MRALVLTVVLASASAAGGVFHPASRPDLAVRGRWLVVLRDVPRDDVPLMATALVGPKGQVLRAWRSALTGFLATMPEADARRLAEHPRVQGVWQDLALDTLLSAPIPDCSVGVTTTALPPSTTPQPLTCSDPDPQMLSATCIDNWGLDRLDGTSVTRDGVYGPPRTGVGVHLFVVDTGLYAQHQDFQGRVGLGHDATGVVGNTDDCGSWSHGTHVAAIAAGTRYGVAKGATLHSVRVAPCPLSIEISSLVSAFDWIALAHTTTVTGPAVASMSINSSLPEFREAGQPLGLAITGVINAGVLVIESAGNQAADACDWSTAAPDALIVGGADELDTPWERRAGDPNYAG